VTISTHITRLAKAIAVGLALVALIVPAAQAGEIAVDDHWRDAPSAASATVLPQNFRGDDYYRDAPLASAPVISTGFDWADFGIGAGSMLGALVLLTGLSGMVLAARRRSRTLGPT
jgi:hypothetical protein